MNREQAQALLPIMQAFIDGKPVQYKDGDRWCEAGSPTFNSNLRWRIKPDPIRYRRYLRKAQASTSALPCVSVGIFHDTGTANDPEHFAAQLSGFARWIDEDWQEAEA